MIGIGILTVLAGMEEVKLIAYQIMILGSMLFGLGFLAIVIYALLSKKDTSEPAQQKPAQQKLAEYETEYLARNTDLFCQSCGTTLKSGAKFCGECGSNQ
jgi:uncharacterized paraquat-inducible protein A